MQFSANEVNFDSENYAFWIAETSTILTIDLDEANMSCQRPYASAAARNMDSAPNAVNAGHRDIMR